MGDKDWLASLKAGDPVLVTLPYGGGYRLGQVERFTATQILVSGVRFNRETGFEKAQQFGRSHLVKPTQEKLEVVKRKNLTRLLRNIQESKLSSLPLETLAQAATLLKL